MDKYYVAFWDSSERASSHWVFGSIQTDHPIDILDTIFPNYHPLGIQPSHGTFIYEHDGDMLLCSKDKNQLTLTLLEKLKEFDFEEELWINP